MTEIESSRPPQESIAEALHDLSGHTAALARREVGQAASPGSRPAPAVPGMAAA